MSNMKKISILSSYPRLTKKYRHSNYNPWRVNISSTKLKTQWSNQKILTMIVGNTNLSRKQKWNATKYLRRGCMCLFSDVCSCKEWKLMEEDSILNRTRTIQNKEDSLTFPKMPIADLGAKNKALILPI